MGEGLNPRIPIGRRPQRCAFDQAWQRARNRDDAGRGHKFLEVEEGIRRPRHVRPVPIRRRSTPCLVEGNHREAAVKTILTLGPYNLQLILMENVRGPQLATGREGFSVLPPGWNHERDADGTDTITGEEENNDDRAGPRRSIDAEPDQEEKRDCRDDACS